MENETLISDTVVRKKRFNDTWKHWIWSSVSNGIAKEIVFYKLLENNFDYCAVRDELSFDLAMKEAPFRNDKTIDNPVPKILVKKKLPNDTTFTINTKRGFTENIKNKTIYEDKTTDDPVKAMIEAADINLRTYNDNRTRTDPVGDVDYTDDYHIKRISEWMDGKNTYTGPTTIRNATKYEDDRIELYVLDDFLNKEECDTIINISQKYMQPSTVSDGNKIVYDRNTRSSSSSTLANIKNQDDQNYIKDLEQRMARVLGRDASQHEDTQIQHYREGEKFTEHYDNNDSDDMKKGAYTRNWTFMVYLNDVEEGGTTYFPKLKKRFHPKMGTAVIWNNLTKDGTNNFNTLHAGEPPIQGEKYIITKWFDGKGKPCEFNYRVKDILPNYTTTGFKIMKMPKNLYDAIRKVYDNNQQHFVDEPSDGYLGNPNGVSTKIMSICDNGGPEIQKLIKDTMEPIVQKWANVQNINLTSIYGIRSYHKGSNLKMHTDSINTHVLSAVFHIDDRVNEPWPLYIRDNYQREHKIIMEPGDMIIYESAVCMHGRPEPLNGSYYRNMYVHFSPPEWNDIVTEKMSLFN